MPLPSPTVPTLETTLPSNGKKIKYRPYLVKEEKLLLFTTQAEPQLPAQVGGILFKDLPNEAKEQIVEVYKKEVEEWSKDVKHVVKDILSKCIISRVKLEELTSFDLEYMFLKLREASAGDVIQLKVPCDDDPETMVPVNIQIDDVKVKFPEGIEKKIMLSDTLGLVMKYPGLDEFIDISLLNRGPETPEEVITFVAGCVDQVFDGEDVYEGPDLKTNDVIDFINKMTSKQYESLEKFFSKMPVLSHTVEVINPNTGVKSEYTFEGLNSFFA